MKKLLLSAVVLALFAATANAVAISHTIHAQVTTDKANYTLGETVKWTINAWTDNTTDGVALLALGLLENRSETLTAALFTGGSLRGDFSNSSIKAFYSADTGFTLNGIGTPSAGGILADIDINQSGQRAFATLDVGNDNVPHIFAIGSFVPTLTGAHTLTPTLDKAANYWPLVTGNATGFEGSSLTAANFTVNAVPEPATMGLVGLGLAGVAALRRRRK